VADVIQGMAAHHSCELPQGGRGIRLLNSYAEVTVTGYFY